MRSCICGIDREMHIPKLAREWRAGSSSSSTVSSPNYASTGDIVSSHSPASSIVYSPPYDESDLVHEAFNERARKSLGIPNKPLNQEQSQFYTYQTPASTNAENLESWLGKLDGVEDGLLNALSFADSWHSASGSSDLKSVAPSASHHRPAVRADISLGSMSSQEEARRQIEAYCRRWDNFQCLK